MSAGIPFLDASDVEALLTPTAAVDALRRALAGGFRPETDHARIFEQLDGGEFLLMPAETATSTGIKVLTIAPDNPARGLARIQGLYVLFDSATLSPRALIDGPALTDIRTSAVSVAAIRDALERDSGTLDIVVFGAGPQARAHVRTVRAVLEGTRLVGSVTSVVRSPARVTTGADFDAVVAAGTEEAGAATRAAGLILCTTTASTPLFEDDVVRDDAVVVAVGSHSPDARELPGALLGRSDVIVEDIGAALRECGDVVLAIDEGHLAADDLIPMGDLVRGSRGLRGGRPVVFKSAGMSWEDLVLAQAIADADGRRG
ncbi:MULTISPECIES: ornithine cyclodeaminase family protein [unclassified Pseudoclavibacter]|uniref:ornithine cyclodeaminase family protein n=1 Tax=unclassified Pseudoclavibacter TaxID=2615177 RepID=UPI001BA6590E|nr:ornithine cyclodeaminase family protein [Pseudoclavibacter sp. Marseille-Q4354]MBS3177275.1 ornithine cyclodeaminase family protein [Pseudoclavibacter sp. Marseille-Q4354]